jgi:hypothetical protein
VGLEGCDVVLRHMGPDSAGRWPRMVLAGGTRTMLKCGIETVWTGGTRTILTVGPGRF